MKNGNTYSVAILQECQPNHQLAFYVNFYVILRAIAVILVFDSST